MMSDVCKHCERAGCLEACPTGAIIRTEFGTVYIQPDVCNGCGYCVVGLPVRRHRPARGRRPRLEVHALLRPAEGRAGARLRQGLPDRVDPVRRARRAARRGRERVEQLHARGVGEAYLYGADAASQPGTEGLNAFFLLVDDPRSTTCRPIRWCRPRRGAELAVDGRGRASLAALALGAAFSRAEGVMARWIPPGTGAAAATGGTSDPAVGASPARARRSASAPRGGPRARGRGRGAARRGEEGGGPSYYGLPVLKEPVWRWMIPAYFFTGGLAGACGVLGAAAQRAGGRGTGPLVRRCRVIARAALPRARRSSSTTWGGPRGSSRCCGCSGPTSPMNMGTWVLSGFGALAGARRCRRSSPCRARSGAPGTPPATARACSACRSSATPASCSRTPPCRSGRRRATRCRCCSPSPAR